jgi:short-subunit dehydrogenase
VKALLCGASGGLASALASQLLERGWYLDLVTRAERADSLQSRMAGALSNGRVRIIPIDADYGDFTPSDRYDAHFFLQALFEPSALVSMDSQRILNEVMIGLTSHILLTRRLLLASPPQAGERRDFCYIGSTSAYAGFKNTSVYCAAKHGLLGFVRAMNDEYDGTGARFWLFSMGTMDTEMGARIVEQDSSTFLQPTDVAGRILAAVDSPSNLFEPEVILRRRAIRFKEKR